ncbi:MAG: ATP-binding cassette subfamily B multidrug efflux pump [Cellvibrionaceae bacterium]|jgi:ATP-binding cassette subfamily B multidrug efflux pump
MEILKRIVQQTRPYRLDVILAIVALIVSTGSQVLIPAQVQRVIDDGIIAGDRSVIVRAALLMVGLAAIGMAATYINAYFAVKLSEYTIADMREKGYRKIQTFSFANLDQLNSGELLVRMTSDLNQIKTAIMMTIRMLLNAPLMLTGAILAVVFTSPRLSLLLVVILPLTAGFVFWFGKKTQPLYALVQGRLDRVNTIMQENIAGVRVVKAFVRADFENGRFGDANNGYANQNIKVAMITAVMFPTMMTIINFATAGVLWFGGSLSINNPGLVSPGEIVAFVNLLMLTVFPVLMLGMGLPMIYSAIASGERVFEVLDTEAAIVDRPDAIALERNSVDGRVAFDNVSFDYDGEVEEDAVLRNITFRAMPGQTVAILGATGSGKSSLINLIARLYEVTDGEIRLDGTNIQAFTQASLRQQIGFALQEAILFSGTIRENIGYGKPNATDEEIIAAAKAAQAHEFIMEKEGQYDGKVEQRGKNFSGGQKQRLAIARALCVKPKILILDDSTSAVDIETETEIQAALAELMQNSTVFVVAQRISTVLTADKILVLDQGNLVAEGKHAELLESSPIYKEIFDSQLGEGVRLEGEVSHA